MDYLSVKEIAELWGVSIRMVNYYLNTGRIQGAIRKSGGWLIPANTPHPADLRKSGQRGQEKIPPRMAKCYMPLISRPCDNGFQNLLLTMNDEEERDIARALHHYFRDEHEEAREISEKYLTSKCPEIRLTALITNTMAMLQTGDAAKCRRNLEMIQRDGQRANDDSWRLYSSITDALISVFFHSEKLDLTPIRPAIGILPPGMQYFAMYAIAHALTPYEFSIAMLAAKGRSNKEIAALMGVSVNTVKSYMESIFEKLQISSRNEIDAYVNR